MSSQLEVGLSPRGDQTTFTFRVEGDPRPQGSKTAGLVGWKPGQKHRPTVVMYEAGKRIKAWRKSAKAQLIEIWNGAAAIDGPVRLSCEFIFARPASHFTSKGALTSSAPPHPTTAQIGDLSKLIRAVEDSMVDAGILTDDRLIIGYGPSWKRWELAPSLFADGDTWGPGVIATLAVER